MKQNYNFFLSQLPKLLKDKNNIGNYVLIENKQIKFLHFLLMFMKKITNKRKEEKCLKKVFM